MNDGLSLSAEPLLGLIVAMRPMMMQPVITAVPDGPEPPSPVITSSTAAALWYPMTLGPDKHPPIPTRLYAACPR
ncbi:hypothetical protein OH76DRAFT_156325 [Lentinus brumalis]|uniref:Uncharacterized protein n=1 Tax=Lentinus brumalis TaxID=2498619 RepID=A0A371DIN6_9APHY|nr:hypothetical protein OH76DRAFT_156325 [Polyporus brumalis]